LLSLLLSLEDGDTFLPNISGLLLDYKVQQPRICNDAIGSSGYMVKMVDGY
jgi:hypothetical protein